MVEERSSKFRGCVVVFLFNMKLDGKICLFLKCCYFILQINWTEKAQRACGTRQTCLSRTSSRLNLPTAFCDDSRRLVPGLCLLVLYAPLQWDCGADSCLCHAVVIQGHIPPHWQAGGSLTDSKWLGNLPLDDPTPCSYLLPSSPSRAARSAVAPANCPRFLAHWLTHPLVPPVTDGVGGTVRQGQKYGLTLITPALLPAITFTAPSSTTTPQSICHQH